MLIAIFSLSLLLAGCAEKSSPVAQTTTPTAASSESASEPTGEPVTSLKGITLTPQNFAEDDFHDFFVKAGQAGEVIAWAGDWNELSNTKNGGSTVLAGLSAKYKYIPLVEAQFFTQSTGKLLRPLNEQIKKQYLESATAFVKKYKPKYFAVGIEVNVLYEKSPADFEEFVTFYEKVYSAIKTASPQTKVFPTFQLEKMKGLQGGLFGGKNEPEKKEWFLLEKFPHADLIVFTTYPGLIYKEPAEIPEKYYTEISSYTNKTIAFTEIGWHSASSPVGWESSEEEQAQFISRFFELNKELQPELMIWSFLYDQNTIEPFNSMGLFGREGKEKKGWKEWKRR